MQDNTLTIDEFVDTPKEAAREKGSVLSAALLIAGTSIGAGMLALPVVTGLAGFFPAMMVSTFCWLFMLATGLLMLEATLWMPKGAHILSMAERFLGRTGKIVAGLAFLFLYYCLLVAYMAGGAPILSQFVASWLGFSLSEPMSFVLFATLFGALVYMGTHAIGRINWLFMASLILSYVLLISLGSGEVQGALLKMQNWKLSLFALPVLFSAYGYHNVIPSVASYMEKDGKKLRLAIIIGSSIPFIVYSLWQWMMIGSIPHNELAAAASAEMPVTAILQQVTGNPWISYLGAYFGFFALITSFLSVSLSMVDFMGDGLPFAKGKSARILLCALTFVPPTCLAMSHPTLFISALEYAGGFGEAILNGLFPIAMVWIGRYHLKLAGERQLFGGRGMLLCLLFITFSMIIYETFHVLLG